jgi:hypothetical protein
MDFHAVPKSLSGGMLQLCAELRALNRMVAARYYLHRKNLH